MSIAQLLAQLLTSLLTVLGMLLMVGLAVVPLWLEHDRGHGMPRGRRRVA
ncbi:hypothetical protein [Ornithinimicrobium tianjinense]|nr:hypothetical protein [Ornithinimicrobium tianjinense]